MTTRAAVISRAASQIGVKEDPPGSNRVLYSQWYGMTGPWCAMFVSWVFFHAGLPLPATVDTPTVKGFAYVPYGLAWFKRRGRFSTRPEPGAVVFYQFGDRPDHCGVVESVNSDGTITAIEGNTDLRGGRTGGQVLRRVRRAGIVGYGLPEYSAPPPPPPPPPGRMKDAIGVRMSPSGGHWLFNAAGDVQAFHGAGHFGSMKGKPLAAPVVELVPTPTGRGYWLFGADLGVFAFGDAPGLNRDAYPYHIFADEYRAGRHRIAGGACRPGSPSVPATWRVVLAADTGVELYAFTP